MIKQIFFIVSLFYFMNLQALLRLYSEDSRIQQIAEGILMPAPIRYYLSGLSGSAASMIASSVWNATDANHIFVLNEREEAAYFHNDLENLTGALDICYFPDSFKKTGDFSLLNSSHVMLRTEALMKFSATSVHKKILVTYPEALFEKVVPGHAYSHNTIQLKTGDHLPVDQLLEKLVKLGFERTDFVYEPGQFAMRGGILDIYSFGNENPYRVELFGEEIDSIRIFDPETQLSERKLLNVTLIPNLEINTGITERIPITDFLPANAIWWIKDISFTLDILQRQQQMLERFQQSGIAVALQHDEEKTTFLQTSDFINTDTFRQTLQKKNLIFLKGSNGQHEKEWPGEKIVFNTKEQPAFNRQFDLLIKDLQRYTSQQYSPFLFAENPRQLERLHTVFEDLKADVRFYPIPISISKGFADHDKKLLCYTDHEIFQRYHKYHVRQAYNKNRALTLKALRELQPGDYVTHIDHGIGVFSGLQKIETNGHVQEAVRIIYKDNDILYVNINSLHKISKYTGKEGTTPKINKLGSDAWEKLKEKTKTKVKDIAKDLIRLYAARKARQGFAHSPDTYLQTELEASFLYEDTPDQSKATADVKQDMEAAAPMDRLICGDVGFGKTEIAVRAAFKSVADSKQAAVLVPTTILAFQHYKTFSDRLKDFPCTVDFINRFKSAKEKKETLQKLQEGKIDIIIGTHALLGKDIHFHDLGVLIIDEEQKFGVSAKEKLKQLKINVDTLTLTATPIPRTLHFSLMGARDLSIINTPPPNRQPIQTEVHVFNQDLIRDAVYFEAERGGQVFFIHNRVQNIREIAGMIQGLCPDLAVAFAHGKMEGHQLEQVIFDFINKKFEVLVCTNIVESGVDIPNANTIIVNNAHHFGLSDLHQLRGRVGRSNKKAFCYLLAPPLSSLPADSRKRLQTLEQHSDLGSGFQIAMRDLDIRGAGNLLGAEQSGFMAEIGFEMYHKILDEAVRELKQTEFKELFKQQLEQKQDYISDCTIDTDLEILIPDNYVENITERLSLYQQMDSFTQEDELNSFAKELEDRFGPPPPPVEDLFTTIRCRWLAISLGFEKIILKEETARCYFINNPDSPYFESATFRHIMQFIQQEINYARFKQVGTNFILIIDQMSSITELKNFFTRLSQRTPKLSLSDS